MSQGTTKGVPIDIDGTLANNSDVLVPSQKAVKTYVDLKAPIASPTFTGTVTNSGLVKDAKSTNIASASTTDLSTANGNLVHITGTTTITSFGTLQAGTRISIVFDGALTLTYNATSLILPGAANIVTAANDTAIFISEGSGNWRCLSYVPFDDSYTNYTPTFTGFSVAPTITAGDARWKMLTRNTCHVIIYPNAVGTSNTTTKTVTLPFNAKQGSGAGSLQAFIVPVFNNSVQVVGSMRTTSASNIANVYNGAIAVAWTGSGSASMFIDIVYQIDV